MHNISIIWSPLLHLNFKSFKYWISSPLIRCQRILYDSGVLFSESWNFYKLKRGDIISGGEPILQNVWTICSPLQYFNFKNFVDPNSFSFIKFECILHDSEGLFSESLIFYKLKRGNLISGGNQLCRKSELFGHPFCISILKVFWTQIFSHSLDFNAFCMIEE